MSKYTDLRDERTNINKAIDRLENRLNGIGIEEQKLTALPNETKVRSLGWAKPYGHVIGWDEDLRLPVIEWDGTADYGPEACEPHEFEVIQ